MRDLVDLMLELNLDSILLVRLLAHREHLLCDSPLWGCWSELFIVDFRARFHALIEHLSEFHWNALLFQETLEEGHNDMNDKLALLNGWMVCGHYNSSDRKLGFLSNERARKCGVAAVD